jgi:tetratricopeptide (TPR) repeat protein
MKSLSALLLASLLIFPAFCWGSDTRETSLDRGIKNNESYSYLLIREAEKNSERSENLLMEAISISPDLPAAYFAMAKASIAPSYKGLFETINYTIEGILAYTRNFWWAFTLSGSLLLSLVLSLVAAITIIIVMRLPADISLFAHDTAEAKNLLFLLVLIVALSAISPLLFLAGMLVFSGIYMKKADRIVVYFFLVFLLLSPLFFRAASIYLNAFSSSELKGVVEVNESKSSRYALAVLNSSKSYPSVFSYALALKREGMYPEAVAEYEQLLQKFTDPRAHVNLGNSYAGLKDLENAAAAYHKAAELKPLSSAYYNLSQISRELFEFQKGNEYFRKALDLNRAAVADYRTIYSRHPNRIVVDETLGFSELWRLAMKGSVKVSTFGASALPPYVISGAAGILIFLYFLLNHTLSEKAYRCKRCSAVLCPRCENRHSWGSMCHACYASLIKLDELEVKERVARLLSIHHHQKNRRRFMKILSFVLPGASYLYAGKILAGFLFLWPFLFFLSLPLTIEACAGGGVLYAHSFFTWTAFFIAAFIYIVGNISTRQRINKGWL